MMTNELFQACEFAKTAADMSIPVEPMPTPEPGSEAVDGMVNASMMDPTSVGAGTYAGAADQAALAQAKARAAAAAQAAAAQKTAAIEEAYMMGYEDAMAEYEEMNKMASVEDAYTMGYEAALAELEKIAAPDFYIDHRTGAAKELPNLTAAEKAKIRATAKYDAKVAPAVNKARGAIEGLALQAHLGKQEAKEVLKNLPSTIKANKKAIGGGAAAAAALAGAGVAGKRMLDARRKAKMMRRGGLAAAGLAGLAGLGYAASKARD